MTRTLVPQGRREVIEDRRKAMSVLHRRNKRKDVALGFVLTSALPAMGTYAYFNWPDGPEALLVMALIVFCMLLLPLGIFVVADSVKQGGKEIFVISETGNDPAGMVPALESVIDAMRNPKEDHRRLVAAYENAIDRMQATIPNHPLAQLIAEGYHPSRPLKGREGGGTYILNHDDDTDAEHWERLNDAIGKLRDLTLTDGPITTERMIGRIGDVVPPLRAVLRNRDVPTWRIERVPPAKTATRTDAITPGETRMAIADRTDPETRGQEAATISPMAQPDALSPVEGRMNASATMTAMALRSLVTSFRGANPSLFHGTDLQTAETMLDEHLPRLVEAFLAADDASEGEVRDGERANFARALGFMRDAIADIMDRHARNARDLLATEARFIEMRHGPGDTTLSA